MKVEKLITFLPTRDLEKTARFYKDVLELELFLDQGDCLIFKSCENAYIGFCLRAYQFIEGNIILTLIVDDVDKIFQTLTKKIHSDDISSPKVNEKYKIYHFFINDPNGYLIEIQKFL
ncbi:MAG TPA: VOC family protein [Anaerolineaceae bacterium]|nr:VOC family protein [Anaerolineaceae bacterium]